MPGGMSKVTRASTSAQQVEHSSECAVNQRLVVPCAVLNLLQLVVPHKNPQLTSPQCVPRSCAARRCSRSRVVDLAAVGAVAVAVVEGIRTARCSAAEPPASPVAAVPPVRAAAAGAPVGRMPPLPPVAPGCRRSRHCRRTRHCRRSRHCRLSRWCPRRRTRRCPDAGAAAAVTARAAGLPSASVPAAAGVGVAFVIDLRALRAAHRDAPAASARTPARICRARFAIASKSNPMARARQVHSAHLVLCPAF